MFESSAVDGVAECSGEIEYGEESLFSVFLSEGDDMREH